MTLLLAYIGRALLGLAAALRVPALRPVAVGWLVVAALDALAYAPPWLRAARHVLWPAVVLAPMVWMWLRVERVCGVAKTGVDQSARGLSDGAEAPHPEPVDAGGFRGGEPQNERAQVRHARQPAPVHPVAQGLAALYLLGAVAAALALVHDAPRVRLACYTSARIVAVAVTVALLARRRPATWAERAATVPPLLMSVGVVVGVWPLAQAGLQALERGWGLAHLETWVSLAASSAACVAAWRQGRERARS